MGAFKVTVNSQKRLYALPGVEVADITLSGGTGQGYFVTRVPKVFHVSITIKAGGGSYSGPSAETFSWSGVTGTKQIFIFSSLQSTTTSEITVLVVGYPT